MFLFKQKTAYEMRISDWSSDVCSSDPADGSLRLRRGAHPAFALIFKEEDGLAEFRVTSFVLTPPVGHRTRVASSSRIAARPSRPSARTASPRWTSSRRDRKSTRLNSSH